MEMKWVLETYGKISKCLTFMSLETEERGKKLMQKTTFEEKNEGHEFTELRSSLKLKQDKFKENINYIHHNQTYESQW